MEWLVQVCEDWRPFQSCGLVQSAWYSWVQRINIRWLLEIFHLMRSFKSSRNFCAFLSDDFHVPTNYSKLSVVIAALIHTLPQIVGLSSTTIDIPGWVTTAGFDDVGLSRCGILVHLVLHDFTVSLPLWRLVVCHLNVTLRLVLRFIIAQVWQRHLVLLYLDKVADTLRVWSHGVLQDSTCLPFWSLLTWVDLEYWLSRLFHDVIFSRLIQTLIVVVPLRSFEF